MKRHRAIGFAAMAALAALFATWPGDHRAAALGVTLAMALSVAFVLERARAALLALAGLALTTMFLAGTLATWQAWVAPGLFALALHAILSRRPDPGSAWLRTGGLAGAILAGAGLAYAWRPIHASLVGPGGVLVAIGLLAALATAIVLWTTIEEDGSLVG